MDLKERILAYMHEEAYRPLPAEELADGISKMNSRLNRDVDLMMKLVYMAHLFSKAKEPMLVGSWLSLEV